MICVGCKWASVTIMNCSSKESDGGNFFSVTHTHTHTHTLLRGRCVGQGARWERLPGILAAVGSRWLRSVVLERESWLSWKLKRERERGNVGPFPECDIIQLLIDRTSTCWIWTNRVSPGSVRPGEAPSAFLSSQSHDDIFTHHWLWWAAWSFSLCVCVHCCTVSHPVCYCFVFFIVLYL